jgi:hypothetical protein
MLVEPTISISTRFRSVYQLVSAWMGLNAWADAEFAVAAHNEKMLATAAATNLAGAGQELAPASVPRPIAAGDSFELPDPDTTIRDALATAFSTSALLFVFFESVSI